MPHKKVSCLKISNNVIACDLWFGLPPIKNPGYAHARTLTVMQGSEEKKKQCFAIAPNSNSCHPILAKTMLCNCT